MFTVRECQRKIKLEVEHEISDSGTLVNKHGRKVQILNYKVELNYKHKIIENKIL